MTLNRGLPQIDPPPDMIHLGLGQPSSHLLPVKEMEKAAAPWSPRVPFQKFWHRG
ncbi:MAG: hypothetical protein GXP56_10480 [Deltaproteobacteria bacterium]|nr:hypothetical protein [Deltaproteobacteria bacterium]